MLQRHQLDLHIRALGDLFNVVEDPDDGFNVFGRIAADHDGANIRESFRRDVGAGRLDVPGGRRRLLFLVALAFTLRGGRGRRSEFA